MIVTRISLALAFAALSAGQNNGPGSAAAPATGTVPSTVYVNPRASADDPRIGLKAGLYDAGEAIFGLQKLASLPKPPGFAPGNFIPAANVPPPEPPDEKPGEQKR